MQPLAPMVESHTNTLPTDTHSISNTSLLRFSSPESHIFVPHISSPTLSTSSTSQSITDAASTISSIVVALDHSCNARQVVLSISLLNLHPMQTRSKSGIIKKKALLYALSVSQPVDLSASEPHTYKSALKSPIWL